MCGGKAKQVVAIELFTGAGGLALGLEQAGIKVVEHVEIDKTCCETLRINRPAWHVINDDIRKVDFTRYSDRNIDLVAGGFPCQAFSFAGKRLGFEDTRGTLFYEYARCIKEVGPQMFLCENVKGLKSHDKGKTFQTMLNVFADLGYSVDWKVLNAAYYGVGQKRERLIMIGIKNGTDIKFSFPNPDLRMTTLRDALRNCPQSEGASYSDRKRKVLRYVKQGECWTSLPDDIRESYCGKSISEAGGSRGVARRMSWDEPCLTLTCSPSQKMTERCHPDETRPFTVREYARIQSFPDDWQFQGSVANKYKQIGNAVPVALARRIGVQIVKALQ